MSQSLHCDVRQTVEGGEGGGQNKIIEPWTMEWIMDQALRPRYLSVNADWKAFRSQPSDAQGQVLGLLVT